MGVSALLLTGFEWTAAATQQPVAEQSAADMGIQAAPNRCGDGYRQIDTYKLNSFGPTFGDVYLYYNDNGYNCAFTEKLIDRGTPTSVTVRLCRQNDGRCVSDPVDGTPFKYYAGPVYLYAPNTCVRWGGSVTDTHDRLDGHMSGWGHCG